MQTIPMPSLIKYRYPIVNYPLMTNLLRETDYDRRQLIERVTQGSYNLNEQNVLVGLLKHLSIEPEWDLDYLIAQVKLRSYTLCSLFKITSISNAGITTKDVFYYGGAKEHLCLLENKKTYDIETLSIDDLYGVVPMYTDIDTHSYVPSVEHQNVQSQRYKNKVAIIGIDLVELAIGWWLYMKQPRSVGLSIRAYLVKYPLVNAQLIHNQLTLINGLYEHIVKNTPYSKSILYEEAKFITKDPVPRIKEYMQWITTRLNSVRLVNVGHLMEYIGNIYSRDYPLINDPGKAGLFSMSAWAWDAQRLKLFAIYLKVANNLFYRASDINSIITNGHANRMNNYSRIENPMLRNHIIHLAKEVNELNKENVN